MAMVISRFIRIRSPIFVAIFVLTNLIRCQTATRANSTSDERSLSAAREPSDQSPTRSTTANNFRCCVVIAVWARIFATAILP
jgi:hypothetical protein